MTEYSNNPFGASIDNAEITDGTITTDKLADNSITLAKINTSAQNSLASPIGSVCAWLKNLTGTPSLPSGWAECNGQTISDGDSPYDGVAIPDLNASSGTARFLRGATSSGGTGGTETHTHPLTQDNSGGNTGFSAVDQANTGAASTLPSYYSVVWIMRIK